MKPKKHRVMPPFRETTLPPELVTKKPSGRGAKKEVHRQDYENQVDKNEFGKENFDVVLRAFLEEKGEE